MMKKRILSVVILLCIIMLSTPVFAQTVSSEKAVLSIVENNVCKININDNASFEKKITTYDLDKKEINIGLSINNNAVAPLNKPSEIVLVIDNSASMDDSISSGGTRMEAVANSAKLLANELLSLDTVKVAVVSFSSVNSLDILNNSDPDYQPEGTINDAKVRATLTNSKDTILAAIDDIEFDTKGARTDIDSGLMLGSQQFTGTCDSQFIILLTDGIPNLYVGLGSDEGPHYSGTVAEHTRSTLTSINSSGIKVLTMMTGIMYEDTLIPFYEITYKDAAEEIFGTPQNPTVGKFYYVTDDQIEETISESILGELLAPEDDILTDIDIYDYFPEEITENFDIKITKEPTMGSITIENGSIVWHIDRLSYQETASMEYQIKLKSKINEEIKDKILNTNKKVDITSEKIVDSNGNKVVKTSSDTPKVKVTIPPEPTPTPTPTPTPDTTVKPEPLPQTGVTAVLAVVLSITIIYLVVIAFRFYGNKDFRF